MKRFTSFWVFACVCAALTTQGAVTFSFGTAQPATDAFDIFNFVDNATIPGTTPFAYNAQSFSDNNGPPGQTFTTPSQLIPYTLNSISLKGAATGTGNFGGINANTTWGFRISAVAGTTLIPLLTTTGIPNATNSTGIEWYKWTFSGTDRLTLLPNTTYAFDVYSSAGYLGFDATTNATAYAGGFAFNTTGTGAAARSFGGITVTDRGYDRTFHVDLVPEPSSFILAFVGGGLLLGMKRLRRR